MALLLLDKWSLHNRACLINRFGCRGDVFFGRWHKSRRKSFVDSRGFLGHMTEKGAVPTPMAIYQTSPKLGFTEKAEFGEYMQKYGMVCVKMLPYDEN